MKKKKKKSRVKKFIVLFILIVLAIGGFSAYQLISTYTDSGQKYICVNNNSFSFDCSEGYKYIHLKMASSDTNPIKYNIISPSGKVVKSDVMAGNCDFSCNSEKGLWKVTFEANREINIDYKLWEGSFKFRDNLSE